MKKVLVLISVLILAVTSMAPCQAADPLGGNSMAGYGGWGSVAANFLGNVPQTFDYSYYYYDYYYYDLYDGLWHHIRYYFR